VAIDTFSILTLIGAFTLYSANSIYKNVGTNKWAFAVAGTTALTKNLPLQNSFNLLR